MGTDLACICVADLLPQLIKPFNIGRELIFANRGSPLFRPIILVEICSVGLGAGQLYGLLNLCEWNRPLCARQRCYH
jgi:hypothetical protein